MSLLDAVSPESFFDFCPQVVKHKEVELPKISKVTPYEVKLVENFLHVRIEKLYDLKPDGKRDVGTTRYRLIEKESGEIITKARSLQDIRAFMKQHKNIR